jgi:TonB-dependent SusC/RagA subfamily outer membrane receptor
MQKNVLWSGFRAFPNRTYIENYDYLTKIIKVMRITTFFLIAFCVHVSATGLSQTVTLQGNNLPLQEVLSVIKQQTGFAVVYTEESVESKRVAVVRANKTPLLQFLDLVLPTQSLDYEIKNKTIVIIPRIREESKTVDPTRRNPVAQSQSTITGRLQDRAGTPISGATITVKGTVRKTASDERGQFRLVVQPGETLVLTSLGFLAKEILVGDIVQLGNITLEISTSNLDEVSVVAYGTTTRRETIGSISAIKGEELAGIPSSNLANLLQGRVAGMDVTNMSGSPGGGGIGVTIRGFNSLGVEQQRRFSDPLWVVDGVPLNSFTSPVTGTNFLSDINTDMIESVQVLKDASAASLYGSRAANGVIMVTTKKGQKNQAVQFSINFSQSYNVLPKLPTVTLGKAERDYRLAALKNWNLAYYDQASMRYVYPSTLSEYYLNPYSRIDYFFVDRPSTDNGNFLQDSLNSFFNNATNFFPIYTQTGKITNGNIQGYGGSSNMNYGIGLGYYSEKGVYVETGFDRIDLNSSIGIVPSPKLSVDLRLNAAVTSRKRGEPSADLGPAPTIEAVPGDPFRLSTLLPGDGSVVWDNVLEKLKGTRENNRSARLRSNFTMTYEILNGLNISTSGALDYAVHRRNYFLPSYLDESGYSNSVGLTGVNLLALNENLLSYTKTVSGGHNIKFISGFSYQYDREDSNSGSGRNSPSDRNYCFSAISL